ncbi:hypothetical protein B0T26DRAFT_78969 [Lasiosphaeria miniovina]|uniref:Uncharacterized protein n=1 Tax=Lasiosphaeria miniovina TaxID=1954250 RepID=A0AA40BI81_9PEZI|nr:uncharacterized protein B0T26DRAFT_78969 [Lasiosphaeria miniovina]KAK0734696.1 hypothetical protein B0T26DRAFT_78969 [Lasiosphaeria miniovina]
MPAHISDTRDGSAASANAGRECWARMLGANAGRELERQFCPRVRAGMAIRARNSVASFSEAHGCPLAIPLRIKWPSKSHHHQPVRKRAWAAVFACLALAATGPNPATRQRLTLALRRSRQLTLVRMQCTSPSRIGSESYLAVHLIRPGLRSQAAPCHVGAPCKSPPSHYRSSCCGWALIHQETIPPRIIELGLPDKEADGSLSGSIVEGADLAHETYLSVAMKDLSRKDIGEMAVCFSAVLAVSEPFYETQDAIAKETYPNAKTTANAPLMLALERMRLEKLD